MPLTIAEQQRLEELESRNQLNSKQRMLEIARTHVACAVFHLGKAIDLYFRHFDRPTGVAIYRVIVKLRPFSTKEHDQE